MSKKKTDLEKLGLEVRIPLTISVLKARISHLKKGIKEGFWGPKLTQKAEVQLAWHVRKLEEVREEKSAA